MYRCLWRSVIQTHKGSLGRYFAVGGILRHLFVVLDTLILVLSFKIVGTVG